MRGRMALLLGLAMLPAGAIAMQVGLNAAVTRQAAYEESLSRRALQSIAAERGAIDEVREMLRVLAASPALQQIQSGDCREWLGSVAGRYPYISSLAVTSDDGRMLCSVPTAPAGFRAPQSALRRQAQARDSFAMGYVARGALSGQPVLAAMEPIHDGSRRVGFVGASISVDSLRQMLDRGRALDGARSALVDSEGTVIAETSQPMRGEVAGLPTPAQIRDHLGSDPSFIAVEGGSAVVVPLYPPDLYAVMSWAPDQPAWRRWGEYTFSIGAPLLIWLLAIGAGWFAIEVFVARPLSSLESAARAFARGEEVEDVPALRNAPDEIRSLRRTLAAMAKTLRGRELRLVEALREERALLREVHHRVKNNLQMVSSLLSIQARSAKDESEGWGLARAHDRVQLLALVHQRIYASGEVRELRLDDLAAEIARQLMQSRGGPARDVRLSLDVGASRADVDRAVPLAFLIGESLSSVLDCVTDAGPVDLQLALRQDENGETRFAVVAVGEEPARFRPASTTSRLIDAFARQLGATVGRDAEHECMVWALVPPAPHVD